MMNVGVESGSSSERSSGCESGWTLYLDHSNSNFSVSDYKKGNKCHYKSKNKQQKISTFDDDHDIQNHKNVSFDDEEEEEEEDLSMVSDASSGPPHFDHDVDDDDDEVQVFCYSSGKKRQSIRLSTTNHHQYIKQEDFALDDTASSSNFISYRENFISKNNGGENQGCSLKRVIDYSSQGFSATHFSQGRSNNFQEHYGFIQPHFSTKPF